MEPETLASHSSQEMGPLPKGTESTSSFSGAEQFKGVTSTERLPRVETKEVLPAPTSSGPSREVSSATPLPPPPPIQGQPTTQQQVGPVDDNPIVAADEDLIEKEWVDRAKKIIASTKNDPYLQEKEVSKLQADYLKKRYGKEIKLPTE